MKVVVNNCYGGFGLSDEAMSLMDRRDPSWRDRGNADPVLFRSDGILVSVVEELGPSACGMYAELSIIEIPDGIEYDIMDDDGLELVVERGHYWYVQTEEGVV